MGNVIYYDMIDKIIFQTYTKKWRSLCAVTIGKNCLTN